MRRSGRTSVILLTVVLGPVAASAYPRVTITQPANGTRVSGPVLITAEVVPDPDPIDRVDFYILTSYLSPAKAICSDHTPPYECRWRTRTVDNGRAVVLAKAFIAGVPRAAAEADVMVVNAPVGELRLTVPNPMQSYERPRLWGPSLVYHDKYFFQEPYTGGNKHQDLGSLVERDIGFGGYEADSVLNALVSFGVNAVYSEEYPQFGFRRLTLYNTSTFGQETLVWGPHVEVGDLDFFGERVVWADGNVYAIDLVTREQIDLGPGFGPALWGNIAIWSTLDGGGKFVLSYDFSTKEKQTLAAVVGGDDVLGISGQWVVWTGKSPTQPDPGPDGLHLLNLFTGERRSIAPQNNQRSPAIWGGKIVWTEARDGSPDVFLHDLATGLERRVTNDPAIQSSPDVFADVVVWHDDRFGGSAASQVLTVYASDPEGRRAEPRSLGYLEEVDGKGTARGWAVNAVSPEATVRLAFYDGPLAAGRFLGEAAADRPRPDVNRITGYPGDHGFEFALPPGQGGELRSLYVYVLEDSPGSVDALLLDGCPMVFKLE
jgi:beta propeller repeat protein